MAKIQRPKRQEQMCYGNGLFFASVLSTLLFLTGCSTMGVGNPGADRRLSPCPASPNCVCSDASGAGHGIEALATGTDPQAAWQALLQRLQADRSITIIKQTDDYLHAEARSRLFRFVDDLEFLLRADEGVIAMRSASRVGYSDLGANRRRLEALRRQLEQP